MSCEKQLQTDSILHVEPTGVFGMGLLMNPIINKILWETLHKKRPLRPFSIKIASSMNWICRQVKLLSVFQFLMTHSRSNMPPVKP